MRPQQIDPVIQAAVPTMTPQQIDRVIQAAVPELKIALESLLKTGAVAHAFTIAEGTNSTTGIKSKLVCFIAYEVPAAIIEGTLEGLAKATSKVLELQREKR